jgi:mitotic spindle assembly checkpoint protein MAD2B
MVSSTNTLSILNTYQAIISTFGDFLTVAIHTILYERNIYPSTSFLSARKYNYPVRQNRHPKVCKWIQDAVAAVEAELLKVGAVQTATLIHGAYNP